MQERRSDEHHHQRVGDTAEDTHRREREESNADAPLPDQDHQHLADHLDQGDEETQEASGGQHDEDAALHERIAESHEYAAAHDNLNPGSHQQAADEHHRAAEEQRRAAEAVDPRRTKEHVKDESS